VGVLRSAAGLAEAFGFTAVVLADIWYLRPNSAWWDLLPLACVTVSMFAHRETLTSLGLSGAEFVAAVRSWRIPLIAAVIAAIAGCILEGRPWFLLFRGFLYFLWCVLQQFVLQNMIYRRVRDATGSVWSACVLAGILFAAAHVPNPVLVPATLLWGIAAARLFESRPSIIALALLQTTLSALLLWLTPDDWSHQFRIGPGYWYDAR